ncbi:MAG: GGDEF domain-containing protein [Myxococcota bacterium]
MAYGSIESIMTKDVLCADPEESLVDVLQKLHKNRISCVPVCDGDVPVGMITERDIVGIAARALAGEENRRVAGEVMSFPVTTIRATDSLEDAAARAQSAQIRHLPVVDDDGRLLGVVTQSDLLSRRLMQELIEERTIHLTTANKRLGKLARLDGLLGIGNRRWMEECLTKVHAQLQREGKPYSIALCDVDHFKQYNDRYGHLAGDNVLKRIASCLVDVLRGADRVFRFGGEELLVLLPETVRVEAARAGERICEGVRGLQMQHEESSAGVVTVSCGVASASPEEPQWRWQGVIQLADEALYFAKHHGRDQVAIACDGV